MRVERAIPDFTKYDGGENFTYENIEYVRKGDSLGKGTYGKTFLFEASNLPPFPPKPKYLVVKNESALIKQDESKQQLATFPSGADFQNEAHWNQRVHGLGVFSGNPKSQCHAHYVLMPYIEGITLHKTQIDTIQRMIFLWVHAAKAVDELHKQHHAVHRDIKTDNMIMSSSENKITLIDFGLTTEIGKSVERYSIKNKKRSGYIAHELFGEGKILTQTAQDIFSLGVLLSDLLRKMHNTLGKKLSSEEARKNWFDRYQIQLWYLRDQVDALMHNNPSERPEIMKVISSFDSRFLTNILPEPATPKNKAIDYFSLLRDAKIILTSDIFNAIRVSQNPMSLVNALIFLAKNNIEITPTIFQAMVTKHQNAELFAKISVIIHAYDNNKKSAGFFARTGAASDRMLKAWKIFLDTGKNEKLSDISADIPGQRLQSILQKQNLLDHDGHWNKVALGCLI